MREGEDNDFSNIEFVFLDRDGVINRRPPRGQYVTSREDLELLPGAAEAIAVLNRSGRRTIVVTNQRGIALGLYSLEELDKVHDRLRIELQAHGAHLDAIYVCPHDVGQCSCRKPLPGLFGRAFGEFPAARAENSVMIGDSLRDIEAGRNVGMRTVFIEDAEVSASEEDRRARALAQLSVSSLEEFVHRYLAAEHLL